MKKDELTQKLNELLTEKIIYEGEFYLLFLIEKEHDKFKINFLNRMHYDYILKHLLNDILAVVGINVSFGYLNLKTATITLKNSVQESEVVRFPVKEKEKVELPTIRNKTIKEIKQFIYHEYDKIKEENLKLMDEYKDKNFYESVRWTDNWGQIHFISKLNEYLNKIKDYDED